MLERVDAALGRLDTPLRLWALLLASGGFFWLFNFSELPVSNPTLMRLDGGVGLLDLRWFYTAGAAYRALESYGAAGRAFYLHFLAADFVFIPLYGFGFALLIRRVSRAAWGETTPWRHAALLPLATALLDCVENLCTLSALLLYPARSTTLGTLGGLATLAKQSSGAAGMVFLAIAALAVLIQRLKRG